MIDFDPFEDEPLSLHQRVLALIALGCIVAILLVLGLGELFT